MYAAGSHRTLMKLLRWHDRMCCVIIKKRFQVSQSIVYKNPCLNFQEHLDIPISKSEENFFNPSIESMKCAQDFFVPNEQHVIRRIGILRRSAKCPEHNLPEVAIIGRVNAGKSSFLRAVLPTIPDLKLRVSEKPSTTRSVRFFQVGNMFCLVDTPGYGYGSPILYEKSVINYLKRRQKLTKVFLLIDSSKGLQSGDEDAIQLLGDLKISFAIILTKIDAISDNERLKHFLHVHNIRNKYQLNAFSPQIFMVSSRSFEGIPYFKAFLAHITGNLKFETS